MYDLRRMDESLGVTGNKQNSANPPRPLILRITIKLITIKASIA